MAARGIFAHLGTIDEGYNSELQIVLFNMNPEGYGIAKGQRIGQLVIGVFLEAQAIKVDAIEERRGGFGSSDV